MNETDIYPENFASPKHKYYSKSRSSKTVVNKGGGVAIWVPRDISSKQRNDLNVLNEVYGFSKIAVEIFAWFLKNRQQCVKINDVYSEWLETNHGVPQGTVVGPLVLLLYINEFREKVQGNFDINQFADDTSFHFSRNNVSGLEKCVSEILEKTHNYLKQNKLTMNTGETELLCVSKEHENFDPIVFRGQEIKPQSHFRHLVLRIDSKSNFQVQLNKVLSNMATAIRSIYLLRYQLPLTARLMLFKYLVLSHLTFSALFFQN